VFRPLRMDDGDSGALTLLSSAEQVCELTNRAAPGKLTAVRDLAYIRWRYFSGRDASVATFAFPSRQPDCEIVVTVNRRARGYRGQIETLNVLDVYPEVAPQEWLRIVAALAARYRNTVDAIVLRNLDAQKQSLLCARGFQARKFDAPIGWCLDQSRSLPAREWYLVPADGDGLI